MKHLLHTLTLSLSLSLLATTAMASSWKTLNGTSSRFEFSLGGGYSMLGYQYTQNASLPDITAQSIGSWNAKAHLSYRFFFTPWMGLGVGANFQRYGGGTEINGSMLWQGVTDTDGERYNHTLTIHKWQQTDQMYIVEFPVSLCFAIPVKEAVSLTIEAGGLYGMPMIRNYTGSGELTHTGYYEPWHLTLSNQPDHGFYSEHKFSPKSDIQTQNAWAVFGKIGVAIELVEHLDLLIQAYGHYYLTSPISVTTNGALGFRNDREGMQDAHYFMNDYSSLTTISIIKADPKPLSIGLEVGIRYSIPHKTRHSKCNCYDNGPVLWAK